MAQKKLSFIFDVAYLTRGVTALCWKFPKTDNEVTDKQNARSSIVTWLKQILAEYDEAMAMKAISVDDNEVETIIEDVL